MHKITILLFLAIIAMIINSTDAIESVTVASYKFSSEHMIYDESGHGHTLMYRGINTSKNHTSDLGESMIRVQSTLYNNSGLFNGNVLNYMQSEPISGLRSQILTHENIKVSLIFQPPVYDLGSTAGKVGEFCLFGFRTPQSVLTGIPLSTYRWPSNAELCNHFDFAITWIGHSLRVFVRTSTEECLYSSRYVSIDVSSIIKSRSGQVNLTAVYNETHIAILDNHANEKAILLSTFLTTRDVSNWADEHYIFVGPLTNIPVFTSVTHPEKKALKIDEIAAGIIVKSERTSSDLSPTSLQFYTRTEETNSHSRNARQTNVKYIEPSTCTCPDPKLQFPKSFSVGRSGKQRTLCYPIGETLPSMSTIQGTCLNKAGKCECLDLLGIENNACFSVDGNGDDKLIPLELGWSYINRNDSTRTTGIAEINMETIHRSPNITPRFEMVLDRPGNSVEQLRPGHHISNFKTIVHFGEAKHSCCHNHEFTIQMKMGSRILSRVELKYSKVGNTWKVEEIPLPPEDSFEITFYPRHPRTIAQKLFSLYKNLTPARVTTANGKINIPLNSVVNVKSKIQNSFPHLKWRTVNEGPHQEYYLDVINRPAGDAIYTFQNPSKIFASSIQYPHMDVQETIFPGISSSSSTISIRPGGSTQGSFEIHTRRNDAIPIETVGPLYENQCISVKFSPTVKLYYMGEGSKFLIVSDHNNSNRFCIGSDFESEGKYQLADQIRKYIATQTKSLPKCTGIFDDTPPESGEKLELTIHHTELPQGVSLKLQQCLIIQSDGRVSTEKYLHHSNDKLTIYTYLTDTKDPNGPLQCTHSMLRELCPKHNRHTLDIKQIIAEYTFNVTGRRERYLMFSAAQFSPNLLTGTGFFGPRVAPKTWNVNLLPHPNCSSAVMWTYQPIDEMHRVMETHKSKYLIEWGIEEKSTRRVESELLDGYVTFDSTQSITSTFDGPTYQCSGPYWYDSDTDTCKPAIEFMWWRMYSWSVSVYSIYGSIIMVIAIGFFITGILFCLKCMHITDLYSVEEIRSSRVKVDNKQKKK